MTNTPQHYAFAPIDDDPALVRRIRRLEAELAEEIGSPVTLIAYVPKQDGASAPSCRAGLDD